MTVSRLVMEQSTSTAENVGSATPANGWPEKGPGVRSADNGIEEFDKNHNWGNQSDPLQMNRLRALDSV